MPFTPFAPSGPGRTKSTALSAHSPGSAILQEERAESTQASASQPRPSGTSADAAGLTSDPSAIQAIPRGTVHRITSGQVVLDLQGALKELIENALDAGATNIEVRFKDYGGESIEVIDNGSGIDPSNYDGVGLKHHTSKLQSFSDLTSVSTFGFRGEAISSLCALARVQFITATKETAPMGTVLELGADGAIKDKRGKAARQDLFASLPVRRREFERNLRREYAKAQNVLQAYALISKGVRWNVSNTPKGGRKTPVLTLQSASGPGYMLGNVSTLFGAKAAQTLMPVDLTLHIRGDDLSGHEPSALHTHRARKKRRMEAADDRDVSRDSLDIEMIASDTQSEDDEVEKTTGDVHTTSLKVIGLISKPQAGQGRASTDRQNLYLNGRPWDNARIVRAVNEVYRTFNGNQSPFVAANFEVPGSCYDINVSPDKRTLLIHDETLVIEHLKTQLEAAFAPLRGHFAVSRTGQGASEATTKQSHLNFGAARSSDACEPLDPGCLPDRHPSQESGMTASPMHTPGDVTLPSSSVEQEAARGRSGVSSAPLAHVGASPEPPEPTASRTSPFADAELNVDDSLGRPPTDLGDVQAGGRTAGSSNSSIDFGLGLQRDNGNGQQRSNTEAGLLTKPRPTPQLASSLLGTLDHSEAGVRSVDPPTHSASRALRASRSAAQTSLSLDLRSTLARYAPPGSLEADPEEALQDAETLEHRESSLSSEECGSPPTSDGQSNTEVHAERAPHPTEDADAERELHLSALDECSPHSFNEIQESHARSYRDEILSFVSSDESLLRFDLEDLERRVRLMASRRETSASAAETDSLVQRDSEADPEERIRGAGVNAQDRQAVELELSRVINKADFKSMEVAGQFNLGFIIARRRKCADNLAREMDDLFIVDQHASDEKYNFETLQRETRIRGQRLISPRALELSPADELVAAEHIEVIQMNGFEIEFCADAIPGSRVKLISQPVSKGTVFGVADLEELIHLLSESVPGGAAARSVRCSKARAMFASRACRKSVMIGKALNQRQMSNILLHLSDIEQPWNCPHGRPTMRHLADLKHVRTAAKGEEGFQRFARRPIDWSRLRHV